MADAPAPCVRCHRRTRVGLAVSLIGHVPHSAEGLSGEGCRAVGGRWVRTGRRGLVCLAALVLVGGCGSAVGGAGGAAGTTGTTGAAPAADGPQTYAVPVKALHLSPDGRTVIIDVDRGMVACPVRPHVYNLEEDAAVVDVNVTVDVGPTAGCPTDAVTTVPVPLSAPLGSRSVSVNSTLYTVTPTGFATCDPEIGCHPPTAGCNDESYRATRYTMDLPLHGVTWNVVGCDGTWMIMDVDTGHSGCAAAGSYPDGQDPCANNHQVRRWFFHNVNGVWTSVGGTTAPGCPPGLPTGFPTALCQNLGAVGSPATPAR